MSSLVGRNTGYGWSRRIHEAILSVLYQGDWPARLWALLPASGRVDEVDLVIESPGATPHTICFLSDIHIGPTTSVRTLDRVREIVHRRAPDVLLLGGDYVFLEATPDRLDRLRAFVRSMGVERTLAVIGNHDGWTHRDEIETALREAGAEVLVNQCHLISELGLSILGLDDPWTGQPSAPDPPHHPEAGIRLVLCHAPDGLVQPRLGDWDLFLCGHTHGGMVAAPWGPIVLPEGGLCRRFPGGEGEWEGKRVFVSRGVGGVEVPVRTFARPDVTFIEVRPAVV